MENILERSKIFKSILLSVLLVLFSGIIVVFFYYYTLGRFNKMNSNEYVQLLILLSVKPILFTSALVFVVFLIRSKLKTTAVLLSIGIRSFKIASIVVFCFTLVISCYFFLNLDQAYLNGEGMPYLDNDSTNFKLTIKDLNFTSVNNQEVKIDSSYWYEYSSDLKDYKRYPLIEVKKGIFYAVDSIGYRVHGSSRRGMHLYSHRKIVLINTNNDTIKCYSAIKSSSYKNPLIEQVPLGETRKYFLLSK